MTDFNVNDFVRVRLTAEGRRIHAEAHAGLMAALGLANKYRAPEEDADGWSRWQLWDLMSTFGTHMFNGCTVPFETTIRLEPRP